MARPSKNNPTGAQKSPAWEKAEKDGSLQKLYKNLETGMSRSSAMAHAGLPISTVYTRMEQDENFRKKVEACEEIWMGFVENKKANLIQGGYRPAIEKELKSKKREIYGDRIEQDNNLKVDGTIEIKVPE